MESRARVRDENREGQGGLSVRGHGHGFEVQIVRFYGM
jgi:hypothetical protein